MKLPYIYRSDTAFFPPVATPRASGHLDVGDGQKLWWEEFGPATGIPVVIVHGGPGGYSKPYYRRLLDPARHRGILFDQRGCGKSLPFGTLQDNTTWHLVADMEKLRLARGVDRWIVVGGSWGSTLALAYAEAHPEHVAGLLVSGVHLADVADRDWWWEGVRTVYPEVLAARDSLLTPEERRGDLRAAFLARVLDPDPAIHGPAATVLGNAEGQALDLYAPDPPDDLEEMDAIAISGMRMFAHYDKALGFLRPGQLLADAHRLAGVPGEIVSGRSDMCTPPRAAYELARAWVGSRLTIVPAAGHRWSDEALGRAMIASIGRLAGRV